MTSSHQPMSTPSRRRPSIGHGPTPMSRRRFIGGLAVGGLTGYGLSACVTTGSSRSVDYGNPDELAVLNWAEYIDAGDDGDVYYPGGTLDRMAGEGLSVDYRPDYEDNVSGFDLIINNAVGQSPPVYDIVVPTNWRAAQMINNGWAEPLPIELIPNHVNIDPAFLTNSWDRGCRFQMPWQAGITGIAYNPALTGGPITSINQLFDSSLAGRVGFIGEMREAVGLAMLADGADPSRPTEATAQAGLDRIVAAAQSGQVGAFTFEDFADLLKTGELAAAMAWSGDVALLQDERPDIEFVIPDEGAIQWFDTMVIPKGSDNIAAAGRFMNFVYDVENAADITAKVSYISPVLGVQDALARRGGFSTRLAESPVLFPDPATRNRLFTWGGLDPEIEDRLDAEYALLLG